MPTPTTRTLSGGMHYFRTLPAQWPDRLTKLRSMGLDTVETYVPWNLHEPTPGEFDFTGRADLERFLRDAAAADLKVIVRPGPYICAEWDNGGLPSWLPGPLRCHDPRFLNPVDRFFDELIPLIARHQVTRGGNVSMVQVENEYGSYGNDQPYLRHLADGLRDRGIEVPLFTSDGTSDLMLTAGTLPGVRATANFGRRAAEQFAALARHRPGEGEGIGEGKGKGEGEGAEPFCMEFWNGWFDHYGDQHTTRDAADAAATLAEILDLGGSVNLYMACGGTNFGFTAGANAGGDHADGAYEPTVTSYDYDAPISESGALTPKYWAYREVLARYTQLPPAPTAAAAPAQETQLREPQHPETRLREPRLREPRIELNDRLALLDCLDVLSRGTVHSAVPPTFEDLGQAHGLAVHRTRVPGPRSEAEPLRVKGLHDRAHVLVDGEPVDVLERDGRTATPLSVPSGGAGLTLVVESMGRVNYGPLVGERKGIVDGVLHERQYLFGWETDPVPLTSEDIGSLPWGRETSAAGPSFHRGTLYADEPRDAFVALPGWTKGYVWVNGFNLGRYWSRGPQVTLYLPWPLLRTGPNEIVVLELDQSPEDPAVETRTEPQLSTN
ncbi:glycoside hydrolase family 35 protein [Streptomyces iconiensis]|uniref:Beta-galactosidase n=1 Tax=Streptomyces iconiensis TaxID=1384038 RepID=A0ABT7A5N3_9ACTN|nr:beta-galactosidase family protein [Streptomyces iconiensis]MDJ1136329.1 beta-galactosidase [Streptomyces iconiensis]